ncbi:MAG: Lpg1974 family pore-forming outer membrane protein [Gemmataceae bacterium]|nr:Lpg1974 family pore-forming outer membrane protein [Gemmataceae bacterium]
MRDMKYRYFGGVMAAAAVLAVPVQAWGQHVVGTPALTDGSDGGFQVPINADPIYRLPTGRAGDSGFYTAAEFVMLTQTRDFGSQTIAVRGFFDSSGVLTGIPGLFVGSGTEALNTRDLSRQSYQPGFNVEIGYRFDNGMRLFFNYMQLIEAHYSLGATLVPPLFRGPPGLADTFLSAPVFNFPPNFAGPARKVQGFDDYQIYGIWNAASTMDIRIAQRYQEMNAGYRIPLLETDYSRVYGAAGGRFAWFFERFQWWTFSYDIDGNITPQDTARYTNTLSQRMYGPFIGCGHEIFILNQFSLSTDLTAAMLFNVAKMRAKYQLGENVPADIATQSKFGREEFRVVPNLNAAVNFWWYPVEGVQIRVGYQALMFFNTLHMDEPVGFNYGNIDPSYKVKEFRLLHGFNVGIGFFF